MDEAEQIDREKIEKNGWRQGAVCQLSALQAFENTGDLTGCFSKPTDALAILVSHDCDIVNRELTKEPIAEWLVASRIQATQSYYVHGKNSRRYHFKHNGICYELLAHRRFSTHRSVLETLTAEKSLGLPLPIIGQVAEWLSKRYIRSAFPDAFNQRTKEARSQANDALDRDHELLHQIYIKVHPRKELPVGQPYEVIIIGVMEADDYRNEEKRIQCDQVMGNLETYLADCDGIDVKDSSLRSDDDVPMSWLKYYVAWDFDYLTFRDEEPDERQ